MAGVAESMADMRKLSPECAAEDTRSAAIVAKLRQFARRLVRGQPPYLQKRGRHKGIICRCANFAPMQHEYGKLPPQLRPTAVQQFSANSYQHRAQTPKYQGEKLA